MHLARREASNCVLCAFRLSEWRNLNTVIGGSRRSYRIRKERWYPSNISRPPKEAGVISNHVLARAEIKPSIAQQSTTRSSSRSLFKRDDLRYSLLTKLILAEFTAFRHKHSQSGAKLELESWGIKTKGAFKRWAIQYQLELTKCCAEAVGQKTKGKKLPPLFEKLRNAFIAGDVRGLAAALKFSFISFVMNHGFSKAEIANQRKLADLRYPLEWFPETRAMQRKIHLHVGPTNSGKTYQALKRLEEADSGIYAGPLRLLAHEVFTRLNAKGRLCSLVTGEERRVPEGQEALLSSCTVEMVPLNATVDVAVIDEIQMMGDVDRGWAWTQAFLGVRAKEVHLCGELRTVPLIQDLCAAMGDSLEIHEYERLSPLKTMNTSLKGDLKRLQKGDAIILFSRIGIHAMKKEVEHVTGKRCAVVYGSLPPEIRAQQARLFNDPDNEYDFLVASDAVGMGLNLSIKRIIFESTSKHDGVSFRSIQISEMKQIAGRAGRYRTAAQAIEKSQTTGETASSTKYPLQLALGQSNPSTTAGLVTTLEDFDMPILKSAMSAEVPPLSSAGILPPAHVLTRFAAYFPPHTPFSYILLRLRDIAATHPRFQLCRYTDQLGIADAIQPYNLMVDDRVTFIAAPANLKDEGMVKVLKALAKCVADQNGGELLDIKEINLELLDQPPDVDGKEYLRKMEALHKALTLYLWLSYRFAGVFRSQPLAFHVKSLVEDKIDECLAQVRLDPERRKRLNYFRKKAVLSHISQTTEDVMRKDTAEATSVALPSSWEDGSMEKPFLDINSELKDHSTATAG